MRGYQWVCMLCVVLLGGAVGRLHAEDIGCVSTTFRVLGANDKICVSAFDDPKVPGVACHLSQARTGGMKGTVGVAEDRSRFAIACRQIGPITVDLTKLPKEAEVFSVKTSLIFKETRVVRMVDLTRRTLVYLAYSTRVVEGVSLQQYLDCACDAVGAMTLYVCHGKDMSEHVRGHRTVDAGFVGDALEDTLNRARCHTDGVMDGKVAIDQQAYPAGEGIIRRFDFVP